VTQTHSANQSGHVEVENTMCAWAFYLHCNATVRLSTHWLMVIHVFKSCVVVAHHKEQFLAEYNNAIKMNIHYRNQNLMLETVL